MYFCITFILPCHCLRYFVIGIHINSDWVRFDLIHGQWISTTKYLIWLHFYILNLKPIIKSIYIVKNIFSNVFKSIKMSTKCVHFVNFHFNTCHYVNYYKNFVLDSISLLIKRWVERPNHILIVWYHLHYYIAYLLK